MKITILNGSPKGITSVTMQYVQYIQKMFPQHELDIVHVAQRIKKIERDEQAFQKVVDQVRSSDGVLWAFPLYYCLVHGNYKRFIELIWERDAKGAFEGKHAAALSTSIHFYDHTAHNYIHAICDDLVMRFTGSFSADMNDLLEESGRAKLTTFAQSFFSAIENNTPTPRSYMPVICKAFDYTPGQVQNQVSADGKKIVVVTDAEPHQANLIRMVNRFKMSFSKDIEVINLHDLDIKGGCLGGIKCGFDNQCVYKDKDGYIDFYNTKLGPADVIVFAGAIKDRYLSSLWKTFFDRSFFKGHAPSLIGKQFGFIISGPLSQTADLRQILTAWVQLQRSNLVGFVTDEYTSSAEIDALLQNLAQQLVQSADSGYIQPQTFLGVGGDKLFRDNVWSRLRIIFQADHRAYKKLGTYDFPQKDLKVRILNAILTPLFRIPKVREEFTKRMKEGMVQPYQKVLQA